MRITILINGSKLEQFRQELDNNLIPYIVKGNSTTLDINYFSYYKDTFNGYNNVITLYTTNEAIDLELKYVDAISIDKE